MQHLIPGDRVTRCEQHVDVFARGVTVADERDQSGSLSHARQVSSTVEGELFFGRRRGSLPLVVVQRSRPAVRECKRG